MYKVEVMRRADTIEKQMIRYIKMMVTLEAEVYIELDKKGFKMDLISGGNNKVLVVIYRK